MQKKSNLCIITVHNGNLKNLKATIRSIDAQNMKPSIHIIVAKNIFNYQIYFFKKKNRIFFLNKDNSIYDGMNYGKAVVKNSPLLFLNSGDFFMNKTTIFNINKFILRTKLSYVLLFGTQLKYDNIFFKISLNFFKDKKHVPHSSFIYINNYFNKKIDFNVKNTISADGDWMKSIIKRSRFILKIYKDITVHTLGGISTKPTISTVYYQFNYKIFEGIKELIKLILIFFMRSKLYYKFIYNRKYTHYEKN